MSAYIKKLSGFKNKKTISDLVYKNIFIEIRNRQSSLKNTCIENERIKHPSEVVRLNRHMTKSEINTLLISRLIGVYDVFSFPGIPPDFVPFIKDLENQDMKDLLQGCNENLSRAFFDKNGCKEFWAVSEKLICILKENQSKTVREVYDELLEFVNIKTLYLTDNTIKYMISLVKVGLNDAN